MQKEIRKSNIWFKNCDTEIFLSLNVFGCPYSKCLKKKINKTGIMPLNLRFPFLFSEEQISRLLC